MRVINAKIVGIRKGVRKDGKPYTIAHLEYQDPDVLGVAAANTFLPDGMDVKLDDEVQGCFTRTGFSVIEF